MGNFRVKRLRKKSPPKRSWRGNQNQAGNQTAGGGWCSSVNSSTGCVVSRTSGSAEGAVLPSHDGRHSRLLHYDPRFEQTSTGFFDGFCGFWNVGVQALACAV